MRQMFLPAAAAAVVVSATVVLPAVVGAQVLLSEAFETDGNGTRYTTSIPEYTANSGTDYFLRTDDAALGGRFVGADGFFFAAQDIDNTNRVAPRQTLTFAGLDVAGFDALVLSMDVARATAGNTWDAADFVHADLTFDGDPPTSAATGYGLWFENDGTDFNGPTRLDADYDGTGEGAAVTSAFTTFSVAVPTGGAATADLVLTFDLNANGEDVAVDSITVAGVPVPEPAAAGLALAAAGLLPRRRR